MTTPAALVFRRPWWSLVGDIFLYTWVPLAGLAAAYLLGWWGALGIVFGAPGVLLVWRTATARVVVTADAIEARSVRHTRVTPRDHVVFAVQRLGRRPAYVVHRCGGGQILGFVSTRRAVDAGWWEAHWGAQAVPLLERPPADSGVGRMRDCEFPRSLRWPDRWEWLAVGVYAIAVMAVAAGAEPVIDL